MWRKELTHLNQQPQIWYKLRKNITVTMICSQWCIWPQEKMTSVRAVLQGISAADGITDTVRRSPLWIRSVFTDDEVTSQGITKWQNGRNDLTYLTVHPHDIILHCTIVSAEWNGIFCVTYHTSTAALPLASSFAQSHKGAWKAPLTPIQTSPNEKGLRDTEMPRNLPVSVKCFNAYHEVFFCEYVPAKELHLSASPLSQANDDDANKLN